MCKFVNNLKCSLCVIIKIVAIIRNVLSYSLHYNNKFEMDLEGMDEEQQQQLKSLWKIYGRESKMGKELFAMYNKAEKPKIQYPKVRSKTQKQIEAEKQKMISTKKCPQKTAIQYPEMPVSTGTKFHPIDFVPKRKAESVIRQQIEQYKRKRSQMLPANRGVDRAMLVRKLQQKFNMKGGILPKGATLPNLDNEFQFNQQQIKQKAKLRVQKKYKNFSDPTKKDGPKQNNSNQADELDELFEQIVQEIEERQRYLDEIDHLDEPQMKAKVKREMIQRVAQLQRITELKNK